MQKEYLSPVGILTITSDGEHITEIKYLTTRMIQQCGDAVIRECEKELDAYFAGKLRDFSVPIKPKGTAFRMKVWEELQRIPYGEVISYKELAKRIENPAAVRAVGGANHHNPINIIIPCHRVIGANGKLTGYGGGLDKKEFLLNLERQ
ncbi:MAG: methylated-DNA--[protein]-cysteine S-methyltransferase [Defluviitaleaceae bacterium]|nr:methylated-DNA--[protein]-cysteine S-methyltransferase [Defluviitaleaceae bacterium]